FYLTIIRASIPTLFPYTTLFRSIINVLTGYPTDKPETKAVLYYTHFMDPADPAKKWWTRAPYETGLSLLHKQKFNKLDVVLNGRSEEHTSELQSRENLVCRLLLE